jgi:hypothetical protein
LRCLAETLWWDYELFDGSIAGPHLNPELGRPAGWRRHWPLSQWRSFRFRYRNRLPLLGVTIYPHGKENLRQTHELWGQASFVFDNGLRRAAGPADDRPESITPPPFGEPRRPQRGEITTFERWTDRPERGWKARPDTRGLYGYESQFRMSGDAEYLAWLLLYVGERFVPNLEVTDDYNVFEQVEAEARASGWLEEASRGDPQGNVEQQLVNKCLRRLWWSSCAGEKIDLAEDWKSHVATLSVDRPELPALAAVAAEFPVPPVPLEQVSINLLQLDHSEQIPLVLQGVRTIADLLRFSEGDLLAAFRGARRLEQYVHVIKQSLHFALTTLSRLPPDRLVWHHLPSMRDGQPGAETAIESPEATAIEATLKDWADKVRLEDYEAAYRLCVWEEERGMSLAEFREQMRGNTTLRGIISTVELLRSPFVVGDRAVARARLAYANEGSTLVNFRDQAMLKTDHGWRPLL